MKRRKKWNINNWKHRDWGRKAFCTRIMLRYWLYSLPPETFSKGETLTLAFIAINDEETKLRWFYGCKQNVRLDLNQISVRVCATFMRIIIELFTFFRTMWINLTQRKTLLIQFQRALCQANYILSVHAYINWCKLRIFTFCTWAVDACSFGLEKEKKTTANWYDSWMNHIWQVCHFNRTKSTKQFHSALSFQCFELQNTTKNKTFADSKRNLRAARRSSSIDQKKRAVMTFMIWAEFYDLIVEHFLIKHGLNCTTFVSNLSQTLVT